MVLISGQGSPRPKWTGGAGKNCALAVSGGAPKTPEYLVLKGSKKFQSLLNAEKSTYLPNFYLFIVVLVTNFYKIGQKLRK